MSEELPMEPAETGSPDQTPDDARRKVDELEEEHVDEPTEKENEAQPTSGDEEDLESPAAGEPEPPD
ncbi:MULTISPECIES: hypothetical protein [Gordonia]|uniref:hypothetical protein n=1 Tax=Gordonia TaxID=2053 RepID=UPI000BB71AD3|nr:MULTISPECIES: hypothetical protein [Gordonia]ATD72596.1 hypothetical protein CNO18_22345 [Gordonia sp. 1D]KAF0968200.1 hypothetical protein BPODLACK_03401 [Gordonia sp. YY1]MBA5848149.1 hypothetical protein [Gordonia amicalis]MCZ0915189.1 hypothetical protein [Gordonia amicalis]MDV7100710.1 hypothetical protein [Gordonia amicalis]